MHMKRGVNACKEARTELERMLGNAKCANIHYFLHIQICKAKRRTKSKYEQHKVQEKINVGGQ
jgi:hypothetical protein